MKRFFAIFFAALLLFSSIGCLKIIVESKDPVQTQTDVQLTEQPTAPQEDPMPKDVSGEDEASYTNDNEEATEPSEPTEPSMPEPTELPTSFLFGGTEVKAGQDIVKVKGKRNSITRISQEEMDLLIALCPDLKELWLECCCMEDYSRIGELTNLTHLRLQMTTSPQDDGNALSDIGWVSSLKNLQYLSMSYNQISDIRAIADLSNLGQLNLAWNDLSDEDLEWLTDLNLHTLYLFHNPKLRDVSPLRKIGRLKMLHLGGNKRMKGYEKFVSLSHLRILDVSECPIEDFSWVGDFKKLEDLRIEYSPYAGYDAYYDLMLCKTLKKIVISKEDTDTEKALRDLIDRYRPDITIVYWEDIED